MIPSKTLSSNQLREDFLHYFENRGHTIVPSSPLIPKQDPTLLFTNAGMVQFKAVFLGEEKRAYSRATSSQKCVRAGGKHNDLENVGYTARHHTFFEMLGNFSFGDYFKEEAIEMGWEFLTRDLGLPIDRLWVSIFEEDEDAFRIWTEKIGVPTESIVRMGEKDNFWAMGETGPCGPCSEILIDQGEGVGCGKPTCKVGCDCDRFLELWNLVFMQYNRDEQGRTTPLPRPSIDTGMGLERISAIVQGVTSNYETDLFMPLIRFVEELSSQRYGEAPKTDTSLKVIADHSRAIAFLIGDGVLPANEGSGYVLRRIMRRAIRHGKLLGLGKPFLFRAAEVAAQVMEKPYPELKGSLPYIKKVILSEEERFFETLDIGLRMLGDEVEKLKGKKATYFPGEMAFRLYDTFGFPLDLTSDIVGEEGLTIDEKGFHEAMELQRKRARQSWKGSGEKEVEEIYKTIRQDGIASQFAGYERVEVEGRALKIIREETVATEATEGDRIELVTDRTPFYGEAGGQVGDQGIIENAHFLMRVQDTAKPMPDLIVHRGVIEKGGIREGDRVNLKVLQGRRTDIAFNHTATHLLHYALRSCLGDHVKQAGSLVAPDRLRFDFTHFAPLSEEDLERIEETVNEKIRENAPLTTQVVPLTEAMEKGAIALFGEKYEEDVRMVEIADYSLELCGGTHTHRTGDIGLFKVVSETGVAAGVRRIEAVTGREAVLLTQKEEKVLRQVGQELKAHPGEIGQKLDKLLKDYKKLEREIESLKGKLLARESRGFLDQAREVDGIKVLATQVEAKNPKDLRSAGDRLREQIGSGIVILGGKDGNRALLLVMVTSDLTGKYHAGKIVSELAKLVGGSGGGRPDMAQAGGKNPEKLEEAMQRSPEIVRSVAEVG